MEAHYVPMYVCICRLSRYSSVAPKPLKHDRVYRKSSILRIHEVPAYKYMTLFTCHDLLSKMDIISSYLGILDGSLPTLVLSKYHRIKITGQHTSFVITMTHGISMTR